MKRTPLKPGYEFIFTLSLLAIFGLPPLVFAQATKDVNITIANGDTTVNGKNIRELSSKDRMAAMKDIVAIDSSGKGKRSGRSREHYRMAYSQKMNNGNMSHDSLTIQNWSMHKDPMIADNDMGPMGKTRNMHFKLRKDTTMAFNFRMKDDRGDRHPMVRREDRPNDEPMGPREFNHKNSQTFTYTNIDGMGISTRVMYRVSEPSGSVDHMNTDNDKPQMDVLTLQDLVLAPQFEAGKTVISFSLPSRAVAEVQFKDSENNIIWSDKAVNGSFSKAFSLGLNGVYYLHVKQGGKLTVKKIFKE